jgi:hypothetical protein
LAVLPGFKGKTMNKVTIIIETGNDAFFPDPFAQLADILESIAVKAREDGFNDYVYDVNGNQCGSIDIE